MPFAAFFEFPDWTTEPSVMAHFREVFADNGADNGAIDINAQWCNPFYLQIKLKSGRGGPEKYIEKQGSVTVTVFKQYMTRIF